MLKTRCVTESCSFSFDHKVRRIHVVLCCQHLKTMKHKKKLMEKMKELLWRICDDHLIFPKETNKLINGDQFFHLAHERGRVICSNVSGMHKSDSLNISLACRETMFTNCSLSTQWIVHSTNHYVSIAVANRPDKRRMSPGMWLQSFFDFLLLLWMQKNIWVKEKINWKTQATKKMDLSPKHFRKDSHINLTQRHRG